MYKVDLENVMASGSHNLFLIGCMVKAKCLKGYVQGFFGYKWDYSQAYWAFGIPCPFVASFASVKFPTVHYWCRDNGCVPGSDCGMI